MDAEATLKKALSTVGQVLYHYKGYYSICIVDYFKDSEGADWVLFFNRNNAGTMYSKYDGSYMKQFNDDGDVKKEHIVLETFHKANKLEVASVERLMERNAKGGYKFQLEKVPHNPFQPIVGGDEPVVGVLEQPTDDLSPPDPVESVKKLAPRRKK